ncbi:ubiquinone biosynthesis protein [Nocardiopsis sp. Huas11]|uniref:ABC1 kinase family protein n=1 Tax=Nocardiopsis sp. Huas11 TaxID=2183912 RepID=UPI000EB04EE0|nr:AarF/UbiB family protein [Nocardiopsis sp. Huas11]RKS07088.1 ubiquinone biosynthesis protein [Nocardiopsis sp. Huas11]
MLTSLPPTFAHASAALVGATGAGVGAWTAQLVSLAFFLSFLVALGLLASRMMGVPFNLPRLAVAGLVGMAAGGAVGILLAFDSFQAAATSTTPDHTEPRVLVLLFGSMAAASLLVFVAFELAVPQGTRLRPVTAARAVLNLFGRMGRYRRIVWILARHGLWGYVTGRRDGGEDASTQRRIARSLSRSMEEAGVVFVKLGQVMATRRDLLSPVFVEELGRLHSEATPVPFEQVRTTVERELGQPLEEVFADFTDRPLAAASIAQAHLATLKDGGEVVVKVQRPGISSVVRRDLDIIRRLARKFEQTTDWGPAIGVVELAEGFAEALLEELDFEVEAANIAAVAEATAGSAVRIPQVHETFTTRRVLVMERLHGTPLGSADLDGVDGAALARTLLDCLLEQVMMSGIFHADPHPGNIMLLEDGVGLLDYGSVGRLDGQIRESLRMMLLAIDRTDAVLLTDTLLDVVEDATEVDEERLRRALGQFMARYMHGSAAPSMRMFTELMLIVTRFGLSLPAELAAVFRALATLEGTLVHLSPGFDTVSEARRFAEERMAGQLNADHLRDAALAEFAAMLPALRRMPRKLDRISDQLHKGRFTVRIRTFAHPDDRSLVQGVVQRAVLTVLAVATGLMSVGLFNVIGGTDTEWFELTAPERVLTLMAWLLLASSGLMILRLLVGVAKEGRRRRTRRP